jgi:hypothetical protein
MKIRKKSRRGKTGSVIISGTEFLAGLARVKAEILSGSGRVNRVKTFSLARAGRLGRVRSGYGSGNQVKTFSLSRGDRVSRVKLG